MISFHNGPAHGVNLSLERAPFFLRVTHCYEGGNDLWDALNCLEDRASDHESLYLYRIQPIRMVFAFMDGTRNGRRYGWRTIITSYDYVPVQPDDRQMRDNKLWLAWVEAQSLDPKVIAIYKAWEEANTK
jgi:hypothetical protein